MVRRRRIEIDGTPMLIPSLPGGPLFVSYDAWRFLQLAAGTASTPGQNQALWDRIEGCMQA